MIVFILAIDRCRFRTDLIPIPGIGQLRRISALNVATIHIAATFFNAFAAGFISKPNTCLVFCESMCIRVIGLGEVLEGF
jgi:hypothetical protein